MRRFYFRLKIVTCLLKRQDWLMGAIEKMWVKVRSMAKAIKIEKAPLQERLLDLSKI